MGGKEDATRIQGCYFCGTPAIIVSSSALTAGKVYAYLQLHISTADCFLIKLNAYKGGVFPNVYFKMPTTQQSPEKSAQTIMNKDSNFLESQRHKTNFKVF